MTPELPTNAMPALTRLLLTHKPAHVIACVERHDHLLKIVDLVWSMADAIAEGRHSPHVIAWSALRDELQLVLAVERAERKELT